MARCKAAGFLILAFTLSLVAPLSVWAHGVGYHVLENQKTVTLSCYYSDGVPVSYAATLVFSPDDPDTEYQNGRTDRAGMFAFVPDKAGVWRIETSDGMGHKVEKSVEVENLPGPVDSSLPDRGAASPAIISAFLGVSLIFNIFFGIALIRKKQGGS